MIHGQRCAVVTGAARGLGQAFAVRLATLGATVGLIDVFDCAETQHKIEEIGASSFAVNADLADQASLHRAASSLSTRLGDVSILINNAGIHPRPVPFEEISFAFGGRRWPSSSMPCSSSARISSQA